MLISTATIEQWGLKTNLTKSLMRATLEFEFGSTTAWCTLALWPPWRPRGGRPHVYTTFQHTNQIENQATGAGSET